MPRPQKRLRTEITSVEAHDNLSELLDRAGYQDEIIVVMRHGKPLAALVSMADVDKIQQDAA